MAKLLKWFLRKVIYLAEQLISPFIEAYNMIEEN